MNQPLMYCFHTTAGYDGGQNLPGGFRHKWKDRGCYLAEYTKAKNWATSIGATPGEIGQHVRHPLGIGPHHLFIPAGQIGQDSPIAKPTSQTFEAPLINWRIPEHTWRLREFIEAAQTVNDFTPISLYIGFAGGTQELGPARSIQGLIAQEAGASWVAFDATYSYDIYKEQVSIKEAVAFEEDTGIPYFVEANPRNVDPWKQEIIDDKRGIIAAWNNWLHPARTQPEEVDPESGSCAWSYSEGEELYSECVEMIKRGVRPIFFHNRLNIEQSFRLLMLARSQFGHQA